LTFNGLHGAISQKIIVFITTAVRTANPAYIRSTHGSFMSLIKVALVGYRASFDSM
jgi:hypothetical protein